MAFAGDRSGLNERTAEFSAAVSLSADSAGAVMLPDWAAQGAQFLQFGGDLIVRAADGRTFVVEGGEVYPHKTTYFYPKLWSGMVLWPLEDPTT